MTTDFSFSPQTKSFKGNESKLNESTTNSPRAVETKRSGEIGFEEGFSPTRIKNPKPKKVKGRSASEKPDASRSQFNKTAEMQKSPSQKQMIRSFGSQSNEKLPDLDDLKLHSSFYIGANTNRKLKAYDFMGYAKRKEIFDNHTKMPLAPAPLDARFEMPSELCPLVSTKHKRTPGVSLGNYSPRKFFTD